MLALPGSGTGKQYHLAMWWWGRTCSCSAKEWCPDWAWRQAGSDADEGRRILQVRAQGAGDGYGSQGGPGAGQGAAHTAAHTAGASEEVKPPTRAFVIARHEDNGYLVLKGFKNRKGLHGQLPGGKIDGSDASAAAGAARELFEETGVDVRSELDRLELASFSDGSDALKRRQFFRLRLTAADAVGAKKPDSGEEFALRLSHEHVGYVFEQEPTKFANWVAQHSGGNCRQAVLALECPEVPSLPLP